LDRNELTLAIAGALVGAVLLGWVLRWIFDRMNRSAGPRSIRRTADMATRLHEAEASRDAAESEAARIEADLRGRLDQTRAELDAALQDAARANAQVEEIRAAYRVAMGDRSAGAG